MEAHLPTAALNFPVLMLTWVIVVIVELLKSYWHNGREAPFFYYRDKDGKEIDLLIVQDGVVHPLEIKKTASPNSLDIRHFSALDRVGLPVGSGGVICLANRSLPLGCGFRSVPIAEI